MVIDLTGPPSLPLPPHHLSVARGVDAPAARLPDVRLPKHDAAHRQVDPGRERGRRGQYADGAWAGRAKGEPKGGPGCAGRKQQVVPVGSSGACWAQAPACSRRARPHAAHAWPPSGAPGGRRRTHRM